MKDPVGYGGITSLILAELQCQLVTTASLKDLAKLA